MGFRIIKHETNIDFIGKRRWAYALSVLLILIGVLSLAFKGGPRFGIDFAGGAVVQLKFEQGVDLQELRSVLDGIGLPGLVVQRFGQEGDNEFLLRSSAENMTPDQIRSEVDKALQDAPGIGTFEIQRSEMVGPKVGADLRSSALEALFYAVLLIAIYISGRFEQRWFAAGVMAAGLALGIYALRLLNMPMSLLIVGAILITLGLCWYLKLNYALGSLVAIVHDVMVTVGVFSLLNKEFDLTIVAALLTIIGYSLNDTIIVFDRIRENLRLKISPSLSNTINMSINQTLSRTLLTSGTTLVVVLCLFLFGGGVIHDFALALLIGIGVGTYSSIFVASPILLGFKPTVEEEPAPQEA